MNSKWSSFLNAECGKQSEVVYMNLLTYTTLLGKLIKSTGIGIISAFSF